MESRKPFAIDIPVTDLDENIDDFRFEETDDNIHGITNNDNVSIDLSNLDFGSSRSGIFKKGLNVVSNLFTSNNKNKYISRNGDYMDDIELINRNIDDNGDDYFDFDNDSVSYYPQYLRKNKVVRFFKALYNSKLMLYTILLIVISLLITLIVLISRSKHASSFSSSSEYSLLSSNNNVLTIVLAIGGLHPHFISERTMPFLTSLLNSSNSVYSPYMIPTNPSSKLTNLWTISTGLNPAENGIIGDSFYDSQSNTQFSKNMETRSRDPRWWLGEPIWLTARLNNLKVTTFNWPGTNLIGNNKNKPNIFKDFKKTNQYDESLKELKKMFKKEKNSADLVLSYSSRLGKMIEKHGFSGYSFEKEILETDKFINSVYGLLDKRNILENTNIMIISDGGYAPIGSTKKINRILYLEELIDLDKINHINGFPIVSITPIVEYSVSEMVNEMKSSLENHKFKDYYEILEVNDAISSTLYGGIVNDRISPIVIIPRAGYTLRTKKEINELEDDSEGYINGFKNDEVLSRSVFIGTGPMFTKQFENYDTNVIKPFNSIEIYDMICHSLNLNTTSYDISAFEKSNLLNSNWKDVKEYPGVDFEISTLKDVSFIESKFSVETELVVLEPISEEEDDGLNSDIEEITGIDATAPIDSNTEDNNNNNSNNDEDVGNEYDFNDDDTDIDTSGEYNMIGDGSSEDNENSDTDALPESETIQAPYEDDNVEENSPVIDTVPIPEDMPSIEDDVPSDDVPSDEEPVKDHHSFWDSISDTFHELVDDIEDMINKNDD
ncbi:hypothetical protein C6P40_003479 [Pichia californica]|uniref:Nucleotide pyrophosphatase n=1 Tax=Pichia californica TaxID=460514 RepID=A0A9P7BE48_9ASCO|nr:hypothetical protein C6P40_003479 [[Candida] californica]